MENICLGAIGKHHPWSLQNGNVAQGLQGRITGDINLRSLALNDNEGLESSRLIHNNIGPVKLAGSAGEATNIFSEAEGHLTAHQVVRVAAVFVQNAYKPLSHPLLRSECDMFFT